MTQPRILYHHRTRAFDGQAVHIAELVRALRAVGAEVEEVSLLRQEAGASGGGVLRRLRLPRTAVEILEHLYSRTGARLLVRAGRRSPHDLIYERHALNCRAGLLAARRLGLPFFLEVNSPMVDEMRDLGQLRFSNLARRVEHEVLAAADRVFVVTRVLGQIVERLGAKAEHVVVTPNGADLAAFAGPRQRRAACRAELLARAGCPAEAVLLGFIGFPRAWHRLDLAIDALAVLVSRHPGLHLVIIGEGPAVAELSRRAAMQGVGARLHVTGAVPRQQVPTLVSGLDVALIPAMNAYASPLKLYDSLAAGVATLAPDQPNLRETVDDGRHAFLFEPGDAAAFRDRLAWVLDHPAEAARVAAAGPERLVELDLTWEANARRVVAEWRRVAS